MSNGCEEGREDQWLLILEMKKVNGILERDSLKCDLETSYIDNLCVVINDYNS